MWLNGRKNVLKKIEQSVNPEDKIIWFHSASLGEFEQGRPVIEHIKQNHSEYKLLLTFFSPSGYEIRKNYQHADYVFYMPFDYRKNVKKFLKIVKPQFTVFIKYEFWYNYLNQLNKNNIPTFLISGIFRKSQVFFKSYGKWYRKFLKKFTFLFVQNEDSLSLLKTVNIKRVLLGFFNGEFKGEF